MTDQRKDGFGPGVKFAMILAVLAAGGVGLIQIPRPQPAAPQAAGDHAPPETKPVYGSAASGRRAEVAQQTLTTDDALALPAIVVEVLKPAAVKRAFDASAWAKQTRDSALGRGLFGSWTPLLGSKGEDLQTAIKGTLGEVLLAQVLTEPFQLVWFQGRSARGIPALVMPDPPPAALAALRALEAVGGAEITVGNCPPVPEETSAEADIDGGGAESADGGTAEEPKTDKPAIVTPSGPFQLRAYNVAETTFVGSEHDGQLVIASSSSAVVTALCAPIPKMQAFPGVDLDVALIPENLGRDAEVLGALVGVDGPVRFAFTAKDGVLEPRGIFAGLKDAARLVEAPVSEELMRLLPEDIGAVLTMNVSLPAELSADKLQAMMSGVAAGDARARRVTFVMNPHGRPDEPVEAALVWSDEADEPQLDRLFASGQLVKEKVCRHIVLATTASILERLKDACAGRTPSLQHGAAGVVAGMKGPSALAFTFRLGSVLWRITHDGYVRTGHSAQSSLSDEMKRAQELMEALPVLGFKARIKERSLTGEGFKS